MERLEEGLCMAAKKTGSGARSIVRSLAHSFLYTIINREEKDENRTCRILPSLSLKALVKKEDPALFEAGSESPTLSLCLSSIWGSVAFWHIAISFSP